MRPTLPRRGGLGLAAAMLAAPQIARAQQAEITVHDAPPHIFKEAKDAVAAGFARQEPGIRINRVTSPEDSEGFQLLRRQSATGNAPDLSCQALNRLRAVLQRGLAQDLGRLLQREGDPAAAGYADTILGLARIVEGRATPEQVVQHTQREVTRLLPRTS